jgi:hypothetical protein
VTAALPVRGRKPLAPITFREPNSGGLPLISNCPKRSGSLPPIVGEGLCRAQLHIHEYDTISGTVVQPDDVQVQDQGLSDIRAGFHELQFAGTLVRTILDLARLERMSLRYEYTLRAVDTDSHDKSWFGRAYLLPSSKRTSL